MFLKFVCGNKMTTDGSDTEVIVNVAHIVMIQADWKYIKGAQVKVCVPDLSSVERGLTKNYAVFDCFKNRYDTQRASQQCRDFVEKLWLDAL